MLLTRLIDFFTLGSDRPIRRLLVYYLVLGLVTAVLLYLLPVANMLFSGERLQDVTTTTQMLRDGLNSTELAGPVADLAPRLQLIISTVLMLIGVLTLMLPVSWVYMSIRHGKGHNQEVAQTLIFLPLVVAGIVAVVQNSLALAFSLAGVVAAVRFRTTLQDTRDVVFVFLAIAVGFAAGVQVMTVALLVSAFFNFVLLLTWRYDFGRNVLAPTAATSWAEPLGELAGKGPGEKVPDRDLVMALTPKKVDELADRFNRVRQVLGTDGKKPRYNAILTVTTDKLDSVQPPLEKVLDQTVKRWALDEVVDHDGKPDQLFYLVRLKKSSSRDELVTAIRAAAGDKIQSAAVELSSAESEKSEKKDKG